MKIKFISENLKRKGKIQLAFISHVMNFIKKRKLENFCDKNV